jgi:hypothetical protein
MYFSERSPDQHQNPARRVCTFMLPVLPAAAVCECSWRSAYLPISAQHTSDAASLLLLHPCCCCCLPAAATSLLLLPLLLLLLLSGAC